MSGSPKMLRSEGILGRIKVGFSREGLVHRDREARGTSARPCNGGPRLCFFLFFWGVFWWHPSVKEAYVWAWRSGSDLAVLAVLAVLADLCRIDAPPPIPASISPQPPPALTRVLARTGSDWVGPRAGDAGRWGGLEAEETAQPVRQRCGAASAGAGGGGPVPDPEKNRGDAGAPFLSKHLPFPSACAHS